MISTSVSKICDFLKKGTANSHEEGLNEALREKKSKPVGRWARIPPGRHPMKGPSKKCLTYEVLLLWARRKVKFSMHVIIIFLQI